MLIYNSQSMFINNSIFLPVVDPKRHKVTYFSVDFYKI